MTRPPTARRPFSREGRVASTGHRVVWQVADNAPTVHERLLRNLGNLLDELAGEGVRVEVIAHGAGLGILRADGQNNESLADLRARGVVFLACENSLRGQHLALDDLVEGAGTVPSGVAELVRRQTDGWSYLRA